jgi:hypothetical protein
MTAKTRPFADQGKMGREMNNYLQYKETEDLKREKTRLYAAQGFRSLFYFAVRLCNWPWQCPCCQPSN